MLPLPVIDSLANFGSTIINKIFPDKVAQAKERAEAELKLEELRQSGSLKEKAIEMSAILAEAQSADPWTSRARPSFLYVIYLMILMSIPMGFYALYDIDAAKRVAEGMQMWLKAIPDALWTLFGAGYLGYSASRSFDKNIEAKTKGVK